MWSMSEWRSVLICLCTVGAASAHSRDAPFNADWRFQRGDCPAAPAPLNYTCAAASHDDGHWRSLDVPHDWSREDLPSREEDTEFPVLSTRYGSWKIAAGAGTEAWAGIDFNDSSWEAAEGGEDWRVYSAAFKVPNATGWYRQLLTPPISFTNRSSSSNPVILSLGVISGADVTYLNGQRIGATPYRGHPDWKPISPRDFITPRSYPIPPGLLKPSGNVLAVSITAYGETESTNPSYGGLYDNPALQNHDQRVGPFDVAASAGGKATGYTLGGVGWYRKHFKLDPVSSSDRVFVKFEGVYMNSDVWCDGKFIGNHPYGYTTFEYDITDAVRASVNHVIAVRVNNFGENSRWYSGSGIYRHVHISVLPAVHIPLWGVGVGTRDIAINVPRVSSLRLAAATVAVAVNVTNTFESAVSSSVSMTIMDPSGVLVASVTSSSDTVIDANSTAQVLLNVSLLSAQLWSPASPQLYSARINISSSDGGQDTTTVTFGVRHVQVSADHGFLLNGEPIKMYGGCVHHDNGPLGSMAIGRAEERRVEILKSAGYNAIRTSHNPVSAAFLDACDRLGVMVMDEAFDCWYKGKHADDYHLYFNQWWRRDMQALVLRDRNHPSVVMWSIGNEIPVRFSSLGANYSAIMRDYVHELDVPHSGRLVTSAYPMLNEQDSTFLHNLEVVGYNYAGGGSTTNDVYAIDHQRLPDRVMVGTESFASTSYMQWSRIWDRNYILGDFIWTAMDYIGETSIGSSADDADLDEEFVGYEPFPWHISYCGDFDIVGHPKPQSAYRQVLWNVSDIQMAVHAPASAPERVSAWGWPDEQLSWSWPGSEGRTLSVRLHGKTCTDALLLLNGREVATATFQENFTAYFEIEYAPGTLEGRAINCGQGAGNLSISLETTGAPAAIRLLVDRSVIRHDRDDLAYVTVEVVDSEGRLVDQASTAISFSVSGVGEVVAVGSGDPKDPSSFEGMQRSVWRGKALAVLRPTGTQAGSIVLNAYAHGLVAAQVSVQTTA